MMNSYFGPEPTDDLINDIKGCVAFAIVQYKENGIYDRVLENLKEHKDKDVLPENEAYQWVSIFTAQNEQIYLARPNKKQEYKSKKYFNSYGQERDITYISNVVTLRRYLFKSVTTNTIAITYGDKKNFIKPFKKISHNWKRLREFYTHKDNIGLLSRTNRTAPYGRTEYPWLFECRACGMQGASKKDEITSDILPENFMTCEESMVKDILV